MRDNKQNPLKKIFIFIIKILIVLYFLDFVFDRIDLRSPIVFQNPIIIRKNIEKRTIPTNTPTPTKTPIPTLTPIPTTKIKSQNLTDKEIVDYIKSKDWEDDIAIKVAKSENFWNLTKSFDCQRVGKQNKDGSYDYGIFQINSIHEKTLQRLGMTLEDMKDCQKNIDFAYYLYKQRGWTPWSSYNNGSYLGHNLVVY